MASRTGGNCNLPHTIPSHCPALWEPYGVVVERKTTDNTCTIPGPPQDHHSEEETSPSPGIQVPEKDTGLHLSADEVDTTDNKKKTTETITVFQNTTVQIVSHKTTQECS